MTFIAKELKYFSGQELRRFATIGPDGGPQVRPVGFRLNEDGSLDIGGPHLKTSRKYRNTPAQHGVCRVVDDLAPEDDPVAAGWGRGVEIRGVAELLTLDAPRCRPATSATT
ncbi:pyridoxamine 5'-phosphate oxidase family protein [Streptomyces sp. CB02923]|uniref:pyridoxamine 5'-phosphate oxidase family protein n=1 Tax=Streptomyces sp. CB02923 TaxID=1718985 RepID=UPI001F5B6F69|nr:pyridoxamine 5'-phosphate oxidase family protein [Streptomyces sp. CB02923]